MILRKIRFALILLFMLTSMSFMISCENSSDFFLTSMAIDFFPRSMEFMTGGDGPCAEINCGAFRACSDGVCVCPDGYTGDPCTSPSVMATIPPGGFIMGDPFAPVAEDSDDLPVHLVQITAFEMDVHEVTNAEYAECVYDDVCRAPPSLDTYDDFPVINVKWYLADAYCTWADKRLPTEAEWEYAARGTHHWPSQQHQYPWGDTISDKDANYNNPQGPNGLIEVESYAPNEYGLYDMSGNVVEWVADRYARNYYQACVDGNIIVDPPGPAIGADRVLRGGSWRDDEDNLRVSSRFSADPSDYANDIGFRCAR